MQANVDGSLICAQHLSRAFHERHRKVHILHDVTLEVGAHEMVAIVGRSGSGKSTLLNCLAGLDDADAGTVSLMGRAMNTMTLAQRARLRRTELGFVFQQYQLVPYLTAAQNAALPLRLGGKHISRRDILDILSSVGMDTHADEYAGALSGGEQQRIALARVLLQQPRIVMADEPTGALDTRMVTTVISILRTIAQHGCVLIVTHDPLVAASCDRTLLLQNGSLVREVCTDDPAVIARMMSEMAVDA